MTLRPFRLCIAALVSAASLVLAQTPPASAPASQSPLAQQAATEELVDLKLSDVDIDSFLGTLEMLTGKTVIRPHTLPSTNYSINLKKPIPRSEAILAVETVLGLNGLGVSPMGDKFLKVVSLAQVRTESPELITGSTLSLPPSGRVAAKFFQFEHGQASELIPQLQNLLSPGIGMQVVVFQRANAAMVTDSISNLQRIETLIDNLDRPAWTPKFFTLKFAKASELVQKIQAVLQSAQLQTQFATNTTITADDRTNQIVLVADPKRHGFFDEMISKLDVKADPNTRTEVIYLKHANSKEVSALLTSLISGQNTASQRTGSAQVIQRPFVVNTNSQMGQTIQQLPSIANMSQGSSGGTSNSFSSIITVLADERTNSVVVNGTMDDLRLIRELVEKVDIILAQVRIEVVIAEVTLKDTNATGISSLGLQLDGNRLIGIAGKATGVGLSGLSPEGTASSYATLKRPETGGYTLTGLLGLESTPRKNNTNILMVPSIITTHNKKAMFKVTTDYPTISSYLNDTATSGTGNTAGTGYRSTVGTTSVGTTLTVTPLIGDDGTVQMEIDQEVSDKIEMTLIDGNEQPVVGTRQTQSFVTARSGDIIVLGGMQRKNDTATTTRLGPIPFIGDLLGNRSKVVERTELIFFLRPVILTNTSEDNKDYLKRLESNPSKKDVEKALDPANAVPDTKPVTKGPGVRGKK